MAAIFFDIDGTLWDRDNFIPQSTKDALRLLKENGHLIFLCSGRTRAFIRSEELLSQGFDGILSGCGTYIEYHGSDLLYKRIEPDQVRRAVEVFFTYDMPVIMEGRKLLYLDIDALGKDKAVQAGFMDIKEVVRPVKESLDDCEVSKFSVIIEGKNHQEVIDHLKEEFDFLVHGPIVMEVVPKGYSKATAIEYTCRKLGIDRKDTYAFGDSINDLEMLKYVDCGIAMGNARDILKSYADYVTDNLHDDGIYNACRHFHLI